MDAFRKAVAESAHDPARIASMRAELQRANTQTKKTRQKLADLELFVAEPSDDPFAPRYRGRGPPLPSEAFRPHLFL